eukprot:TRINITY_DN67725_c10_g1_i1.p1 TRINITY_DN67725_c10_g1~~TRINITY_DN67725_c10_g1_i1.p1  ORF type:complete len:398 (+),score=178.69 TRINITY_DN67725_c10_g1_i1:757-1950(+)
MGVVANNEVYSWGRAKYGQLGYGGKNWDQANPRKVPALSKIHIQQVACGEAHTLVLSELGQVYSFGRGKCGRLGIGNEQAQMYPKLVTKLSGKKVVKIACGYYHSLVITADGRLMSFGANTNGQCGTGSRLAIMEPTRVWFRKGTRICDVAGGGYHSIALDDEGHVYAFGKNRSGQLGVGDTDERLSPFELEVFTMLNGEATRAFMVAAGLFHSAVVTRDGKLYCFGDNRYGQLGNGGDDNTPHPTRVLLPNGGKVRQVACGSWHTLCLQGDSLDKSLQAQLDPKGVNGSAARASDTEALYEESLGHEPVGARQYAEQQYYQQQEQRRQQEQGGQQQQQQQQQQSTQRRYNPYPHRAPPRKFNTTFGRMMAYCTGTARKPRKTGSGSAPEPATRSDL